MLPSLNNRAFATSALAVLVGACLPAAPANEPAPVVTVDTVQVVDTVVVSDDAGATALRDQIGGLEIQLLERDAHIADLESRLQSAMEEAVSSMARVQTTTSRAEAASALADAEIAVEDLRARAGGSGTDVTSAAELLRRSNEAFDAENFGGAAYLAGEAAIQARQALGRFGTAGRADEQLFLRPVQLTTTRRSNIRSGPGTGNAVRFTVDPGTVLTGHAYQGRWIRVTTEDGQEGWIFQTLVTGR